jgi:hypothetical protein
MKGKNAFSFNTDSGKSGYLAVLPCDSFSFPLPNLSEGQDRPIHYMILLSSPSIRLCLSDSQ